MHLIGLGNNKKVYYISIQNTKNWIDYLPTKNWLAILIGDKKEKEILDDTCNACLDKKVTYVCALGDECEWIHDFFDEIILNKRIKEGLPIDSQEDFKNEPITTWHSDFNEGFWFALFAAFSEDEIDTVICLNLTTNQYEDRLLELLNKINLGWLPSNK